MTITEIKSIESKNVVNRQVEKNARNSIRFHRAFVRIVAEYLDIKYRQMNAALQEFSPL